MTPTIRNIVLALVFAILLPISVYTALEISSLNEDEEILENIYKEQLESVIFSLNQYSTDRFDFYSKELESTWRSSNKTAITDSIFDQQNLAIDLIVALNGDQLVLQGYRQLAEFSETKVLDSIFDENREQFSKLGRYREAGYIKPVPLEVISFDSLRLSPVLFMINQEDPCILFYNPVYFVEDILSPRIQQTSQDRLNVTVRDRQTSQFLYSQPPEGNQLVKTDSSWLLPSYEMGVNLKGESVREIIAFRTQSNIIALATLSIMMIVGFVFVYRNIRREMQLSSAKSDFVANVSHEIKTPLALISMFTETLMMGRVPSEEKKMEYYDIIAKETSRLKNIVSKILAFSQIDADKKHYTFQLSDPEKEIQELVTSYSYHLEEKGFRYELSLNASGKKIMLDKEAFNEVMINMIDNAIKYSPETKYLKIRTSLKTDHYCIEVEDHGMGIPKEKQHHVFEKFYRVTEGDRYTTKGTGLGLSLVKSIVEAHGGKVQLSSKLHEGSVFTLLFPLNSTHESKNSDR
jgi:two-component system phosphate regulon sensor histidine kinase PhoR